jgi:hypothetical protein
MRRSLTAHRAASKCAGIPGIPERAGISGARRRCSFVLAGTPVVSCSSLPGEFLRNRSFLRQQAGVGKRLYMVKLYSHGGRLAVLSSRSNRGFGNQGSAYGLRSLPPAPGPPPGPVVQTKPIPGGNTPPFHYSIIPPSQSPRCRVGRGLGDVGRGELCETNPILRFLIGDCGLGTNPGRDATPAACRLRPARAGRRNKPNLARLGQGQGRDGRKMRNECKSRHTGYPAIPLFHHSSTPIPLGVGRDETPGTWDAGQSCETRRPRQKSPSWVSTRVSGPISQVGSVEPDFCRARQTKPICRSWCE